MSPFTEKDWRNATTHEGGGDETTPISAAALEDLETRVTDYTDLKTAISVKEYGAAGDGVTDDTEAIQDACDAAVGASLLIPAGNYLISQVGISSNTQIFGAGQGRTILTASSAACPLINADTTNGNSGIEIRGLTIDGDSLAADFLLRIIGTSSSDCIVEDVELRNGTYPGLQFSNMAGGLVLNCYIHDNTKDGIQFSNSCSDGLVQGCRVIDNGDDGIAFIAYDGTMERMSAVGNIVSSSTGHVGIDVAGVKGAAVTGNLVEGGTGGIQVINYNANAAEDVSVTGNVLLRAGSSSATGIGIYVQGGSSFGGSTPDAGVSRVTISGNVLNSPEKYGISVNCGDAAGPVADVNISGNTVGFVTGESVAGAMGVLISSGAASRLITGVTIQGNTVTDAPSAGMLISDSVGTVISKLAVIGNTVLNSGQQTADSNGIVFLNSTDIVLANNRCNDNQGSPTQDYGVQFAGNVGEVWQSNNDFITGNISGAVTGTPTTVGGDVWPWGITSSKVANGTLFVDSADSNKLKYKDLSGSVNALY